MVDAQRARRGIQVRYVMAAAMGKVPREAFVAAALEEFAYADAPLPIGETQTISQPYVVALMIEAAAVGPGDRVLEVGAGSGYAAAVLGQIATAVYAIERHSSLVEAVRARFARLGYDNLEIRVGDGTLGWAQAAPFEAILVSASGPKVPLALKQQLAIGGRLPIPVGASGHRQNLLWVTRTAEAAFKSENLGSLKLVPLIGGRQRIALHKRTRAARPTRRAMAGKAEAKALAAAVARRRGSIRKHPSTARCVASAR
jgi:protein-L-isoaspartate(D-aspartate) O-methyltransferase